MKWPVLGLGLTGVCCAAAGDDTGLDTPDSTLIELPAPPDLPPQPLSHSPLYKQAVDRMVDPRALIRAAARKHRVRAARVIRIMAAESNFDPGATSPRGPSG